MYIIQQTRVFDNDLMKKWYEDKNVNTKQLMKKMLIRQQTSKFGQCIKNLCGCFDSFRLIYTENKCFNNYKTIESN